MQSSLLFACFLALMFVFSVTMPPAEALTRCSLLEATPAQHDRGYSYSTYTRLGSYISVIGDGATVQSSGSTQPGVAVVQNSADATLVDVRVLATTITSTVYVNCDDDVGSLGIATYSQERVDTGLFLGPIRFPGDTNLSLNGAEFVTVHSDPFPLCRNFYWDCSPFIANVYTVRAQPGATITIRWMALSYLDVATGQITVSDWNGRLKVTNAYGPTGAVVQ